MNASAEARIGDHPALELVNTSRFVNGVAVDMWQSNADVWEWLAQAGFARTGAAAAPPSGLLAAARALRDTVRTLVTDKKAGASLDTDALNAALAQSRRRLRLEPGAGGALTLKAHYGAQTAPQLLAPLAESAAELLATADFALVRKCEDDDCMLWFLDRTKSHRRRWCSMALCGNRHKVASYRQRQQA